MYAILLYNAVMVGDRESMTGTYGCGFLRAEEVAARLDGSLSAVRWNAFEAHLKGGCASCALLAADFAAGQSALKETPGGRAHAEQLSGAKFLARRIHRREQSQASAPSAAPKNRWWIAAAVAALVVFAAIPAFLHLRQASSVSGVLLPDGAVFEIEPLEFSDPPVVRDRVGGTELAREAGRLYREGSYEKAAEVFSRAAALDPAAFDPALFEGVSRLMAGQDEQALTALERARKIAEADHLPTDTVDWFEALALLRLGRVDEARAALEKARGSLSFGDEVPALLEALKSDE